MQSELKNNPAKLAGFVISNMKLQLTPECHRTWRAEVQLGYLGPINDELIEETVRLLNNAFKIGVAASNDNNHPLNNTALYSPSVGIQKINKFDKGINVTFLREGSSIFAEVGGTLNPDQSFSRALMLKAIKFRHTSILADDKNSLLKAFDVVNFSKFHSAPIVSNATSVSAVKPSFTEAICNDNRNRDRSRGD